MITTLRLWCLWLRRMVTDRMEIVRECQLMNPLMRGNNTITALFAEARLSALIKPNNPLCPRARIAHYEKLLWIHSSVGMAFPNKDIVEGRRTIRPSDVKNDVKRNPNCCTFRVSPLSQPVHITIPVKAQ